MIYTALKEMIMTKKKLLVLILMVVAVIQLPAQKNSKKHADTAYWEVVSKRADKIVNTLDINEQAKFDRVRDLIAQQYYDLNGILDGSKSKIEAVKKQAATKAKATKSVDKLKAKADREIAKLHTKYLKNLASELSPEQVDGVKNWMSYNVFTNTYKGYLDMLPQLTEKQKSYILSALKEAREKAMDGGSSKEKHAWFGKYKGRINNYLSAEGYDLNKASKEWHIRLKEAGVKL